MTARNVSRALGQAALSAAAHEVLLRATRGSPVWERTNFRGRAVNLSGGVATALASLAGAATAPPRLRTPALLAAGVSVATGAADDFASEPTAAKGLKGHLNALARGQLTTGAMKLLGISGVSLLSARLISRGRPSTMARSIVDVLSSGALIAGAANLINLFDLRPGRALKVSGAIAAALALDPTNPDGRALACSVGGVAAGAAYRDLHEATMLGDVGANTLGGLLGVALASHPNPRLRAGALIAVVGLILASEKVSFSHVIEHSPGLAWLDNVGRLS